MRPLHVRWISVLTASALAALATTTPTISDAQSGPSHAHHATARGNKRDSIHEARRIRGLDPVPRGASRVSQPPPHLDQPALGIPDSKSLVDKSAFWHVNEPMSEVWRYVRSHRPSGFSESGTGEETAHGRVVEHGIAWSEPDTSYAEQLTAAVSLSHDGRKATWLRADGMGLWLDPRPIKDSASGRRLRVLTTGSCPPSDRHAVGVRNPNPGGSLDHHLLPPREQPTEGVVCRYSGVNGQREFHNTGRDRLDRTAARRLAQKASALPVAHTDGDVVNCPMDDGRYAVVVFRYPGRPDIDLWTARSGCATTANGHIVVNGGIPLH